ncbi:MAG TPA: DoxX family protein [Flavobacteriales bacterium]
MSPKTTNILYWTITGLFSAFMLFSSYDNVVGGEQSKQFIHGYMGYPEYFIPWLGWAKVIGAIALLLPLPARVKEWAYFGFFLDLVTAIYSFIALGTEPSGYALMLLFVAVLVFAYFLYHKRRRSMGAQPL